MDTPATSEEGLAAGHARYYMEAPDLLCLL